MQVGAGTGGRGSEPGKVTAGMEQPADRHGQRAEVGIRADLLAQSVARDDGRLDPHRGQAVALLREARHVRLRERELEVTALAEITVDRLVGDEPFDGLVAVERLAVERAARLRAVPPDQLARTPLVAGMDDAAVAGRGAPAQRPCLEQA